MYAGVFIDIDYMIQQLGAVPPLFRHLNIASNKCTGIAYGFPVTTQEELEKDLDRNPLGNFQLNSERMRILIFVLEINEYNKYMNDPTGQGNINLLNDLNKGIATQKSLGHTYVAWDKKKDICGLFDLCLHQDSGKGLGTKLIETVLDTLAVHLPNSTTIWLGIDLRNKNFSKVVHLYAKFGFDQPFISYIDPFNFNYAEQLPYGFVSMHRFNDYIDPSDIYPEEVDNEVLYIISQYIKVKQFYNNPDLNISQNPKLQQAISIDLSRGVDFCSIIGKFDTSYARWLNRLVLSASTLNPDGSVSQKEVSGAFWVDNPKIDPATGAIYWEITVDKDRGINAVSEHYVPMQIGRYNFHTHPQETYKLYGVNIGFPSGQDYGAYLIAVMDNSTVFHCVLAMEGIYTISITKFWCANIEYLRSVVEQLGNTQSQQAQSSNEFSFLTSEMELPKVIPQGMTIEQAAHDYCKNITTKQINMFNTYPPFSGFGGIPVWECQFLSWKDIQNETKAVEVAYPVMFNECFATERSLIALKRLHPQVALAHVNVLQGVDIKKLF